MKKRMITLGLAISVLAAGIYAGDVSALNLGAIEGAAKDAVDVAQSMSIDSKKESEIGASVHPQILAEMGGAYSNKVVQDYVNRVGRKLATQSTRKGITYHFTVVNDSMVNAFAIPGGYVYVTRGILGQMKDEAELAAVLGHEIGHVEKKHGVERIQKMVLAEKGTKYAAQAGGSAGGAIGHELAGKIADVFAKLAITGYGRKQELEADKYGIHAANNAGYDPEGAVRLFQTLLKLEGGKTKGGLFASHPDTKKRIDEANKEIATLGRKGKATNKPQYASIQRKV